MADHLAELMELLRSVGATVTLHGKSVTEDELRGYVNGRVDERLARIPNLKPKEIVLAGRREVWTATHGWAGKYHVSVDGLAACSPAHSLRGGNRRMILGDLMHADEVPAAQRCARPACAKRWPT